MSQERIILSWRHIQTSFIMTASGGEMGQVWQTLQALIDIIMVTCGQDLRPKSWELAAFGLGHVC